MEQKEARCILAGLIIAGAAVPLANVDEATIEIVVENALRYADRLLTRTGADLS